MYNTGEIYKIMDQFERDLKTMPVYVGKIEREKKGESGKWEHHAYYTGEVNALFLAYVWGHAHGRAFERCA